MENSATINSSAATLEFEALNVAGSILGSKYRHLFTTTGGTIPAATWETNSLCEIAGYTSNTGTPGGLNQSFHDFTWNCPSQTGTIDLGGNPTAILGNFTVTSTGSGAITLGGNLAVATGTAIVSSGATLDCATFTLSGDTFTLASGGNLGIGSTAGITSSGASGNIQTTTHSFDTGGNYIYNGTAAQAAGNGLPATVNSLTDNNTAGTVTLAQQTTVTTSVTLASGAQLSLPAGTASTAATLSLGGLGRASGTWGSSSSSATYQNNTYFAATTGYLTVGTDTRSTPTATLTVNNSPQTYNGTPQAASVIISVSSVPGSVANILTGGAASQTSANTYAVTADFIPTDTSSYETLTGLSVGNFVIQPATLTITANAQNKTYGTIQPTPVTGSTAFTPTGLENGETVGTVTLTYGAGGLAGNSAVGATSTITPSAAAGGTFTAGNYNIGYAAGTLTVVQKALTITADNDTKVYGDTKTYGAGSTAFTSTGLQNGETIGTVTITASGGTAGIDLVGPYTLTPSLAAGGSFTAANYSITYNPGTLQVLTALSGTSESAGLPGFTAGTIPVTVVASDSSHNPLGTNVVEVTTSNSGESFTFTIGVPVGTAYISLKPRFYLRKLLPLTTPVTTENTVTLPMTGVFFVGGDADGNNQVDGTDYAWIRTFWGQTTGSHDQYDINGDTKINADDFPDLNGDGVIDVHDYDILKNGWYQAGDAE